MKPKINTKDPLWISLQEYNKSCFYLRDVLHNLNVISYIDSFFYSNTYIEKYAKRNTSNSKTS